MGMEFEIFVFFHEFLRTTPINEDTMLYILLLVTIFGILNNFFKIS